MKWEWGNVRGRIVTVSGGIVLIKYSSQHIHYYLQNKKKISLEMLCHEEKGGKFEKKKQKKTQERT